MTRAKAGYYASPVGTLTILEGPRGIFRLSFGRLHEAAVAGDMRAMGLDWALGELPVFDELERYFGGGLERFRSRVDLSPVSGFRRRILEALRRVPYGTVVSYGDLARRVGKPGAARAVGGAMRTNPVAILVPCHRVTAHDGSLGGFSAGLDKKRALHRIEGIDAL